MKERPILFSGPMVSAILSGAKTMTRRVVKDINPTFEASNPTSLQMFNSLTCPYGKVGDRLWVRETHFVCEGFDGDPDAICYRADNSVLYSVGEGLYADGDAKASDFMAGDPWKPSIFMPRWASRITLEITGVRVERLNEISEEDAKAEGVNEWSNSGNSAKYKFLSLWDKINGKKDPWASNPWVWVVEFIKL